MNLKILFKFEMILYFAIALEKVSEIHSERIRAIWKSVSEPLKKSLEFHSIQINRK